MILIVSVGAFKNLIGTFSISSDTEDMTLIANLSSTKTLFDGQESIKATMYKARCFDLSRG